MRWYASKAAAARIDARNGSATRQAESAEMGQQIVGYNIVDVIALTLWDERGDYVGRIDVTGRSDRHIDRLARDWIAHGVAPTQDGGRGVGPYPFRHEMPVLWARYVRAEARARRVVRR